MPERKKKRQIDWGDELAHSLKLVGKIMLRVFTYLFNILMTVLLIGLITGTIVGGAFALYMKNYIDAGITDFELLFTTDQKLTTTMYYMDWQDRTNRIGSMVQIDDIKLYGSQNRVHAALADIPDYLKKAFIAIEDKRFESHHGVDWIPTIRATLGYFTGGSLAGSVSGGASTITQQLIKNVTQYKEVTIQRKVTEIIRALKLEKAYTKPQILEMYLNTIYLSQGCYGVAAASDIYFNKDVKDLTLIECAALAAITQYPNKWDPILHPEQNKLRRDLILKEMYNQGKITLSEFNSAYNKDLVLYSGSGSTADVTTDEEGSSIRKIYSWYEDSAISDARDLLVKKFGYSKEIASMMVYTGGFKIVLAMDHDMQKTVEDFFLNESNFPSVDTSVIQPKSSFICIDPETGDVLAIAGDRGEKTANRILNYATQTQRPPGSSIKPLSVYGPALERGLITYGSAIDDSPATFGRESVGPNGNIVYERPDGYPNNYDNTYRGLTTVHYAIRHSYNTVAYKVLQKLSLKESFNFVKNKLHIDSFIDSKTLTGGTVISDMDYAALALGQMNYGLTLEEITAAYSIFANKGVYNTPKIVLKILDKDNNVVVDNTGGSSIVISEQNACIMTKMLEEVVDLGTAARLTLKDKVDVAGKTGTTSSDNDRWFIGYTPYFIAGCWFGYEMPKTLAGFSASYSPALKVWDGVMTQLHQKYLASAASGGKPLKTFTLAEGVVTAQYCKDSGKVPTAACYADPRGESRIETGYFTKATVPTEKCDVHTLVAYDSVNGGVATSGCPANDIKYVSMLRIYRSFPCPIYIADAQYVYREAPAGAALSTSSNQAFFAAMLPEGTYAGKSYASAQFNRLCAAHYKAGAVVLGEYKPAAEPAETEPPDTNYEDGEDYEDGSGWILPGDSNPPSETTAPPETTPPETAPPETSPPETSPPETSPPEETLPVETQPPESETEPETVPPELILPDW